MDSIDDLLRQVFRLPNFRLRQREVIQDVLDGKDVVCVMPTGAGKSLCFQLPALMLKGLTVVVSPLISLMADQVNQLQALGVPVLLLNSSQPSAGAIAGTQPAEGRFCRTALSRTRAVRGSFVSEALAATAAQSAGGG